MMQIYNFFLNEKGFKRKICFPQGLRARLTTEIKASGLATGDKATKSS
jgi:hypothetical protein